MSIQNV